MSKIEFGQARQRNLPRKLFTDVKSYKTRITSVNTSMIVKCRGKFQRLLISFQTKLYKTSQNVSGKSKPQKQLNR